MEPPVTPIPLPADVRAVLFAGGTFDPPHRAHVELAAAAREVLEKTDLAAAAGRTALVFVPAARSPLKSRGPVASDADRVAMLRLALADIPLAAVWTDEIDRAGVAGVADAAAGSRVPPASYWVQTLQRARSVLPAEVKLRTLIGSDQALHFHRWRSPEEIWKLAPPAVVLRPPLRTPEEFVRGLACAHDRLTPARSAAWRAAVVELPLRDTSATNLRERLVEDQDHAVVRAELHPEVLRYIREHGLYAGRGS